MPEHVVVVMPTYNEAESLPGVLARLRAVAPDVAVLVVDDASPDGTGELAERIAAADPLVHVLHRAGKEGLGAAYAAGFARAIADGFDIVVQSDADGSHRPEDLPRLLASLADHDLAVGSRWVDGGGVGDWPLSRRLLSRGGSAYAGFALGLHQRDVTGGYRAFRAHALRAVDPATARSRGYGFQIELLLRAKSTGCRIAEVPITFDDRAHGRSKMSAAIIVEAFARVTGWGLLRLLQGGRFPIARAKAVAAPAVPAEPAVPVVPAVEVAHA
ncbi:polyprenol monophosphomannose synthase [Streptomyces sp. ISL-90]|nr:polyprenol monophosphomannose synthase [Streptomyces sp. ISL-90]